MKCSLGSLVFLKRSLVFPILLFSSISFQDRWGRLSYLSLLFFGTLHSNSYIFPFLLCHSLLFFYKLFVRLPQTTILPFCISFSWGWFWSPPPVQCYQPLSIVLQALYLSDPITWIYFSLPLNNHKGFESWKFIRITQEIFKEKKYQAPPNPNKPKFLGLCLGHTSVFIKKKKKLKSSQVILICNFVSETLI